MNKCVRVHACKYGCVSHVSIEHVHVCAGIWAIIYKCVSVKWLSVYRYVSEHYFSHGTGENEGPQGGRSGLATTSSLRLVQWLNGTENYLWGLLYVPVPWTHYIFPFSYLMRGHCCHNSSATICRFSRKVPSALEESSISGHKHHGLKMKLLRTTCHEL